MKRTLFIAIIAAIICSCDHSNEPTITPGGDTGGDTGGGGGGTKTLVIDYDYQRISPLMVKFTNNSSGFDSYKWDFGDGMWANGKDAMHEYSEIGTYTVTLTGTADGKKYDKRVTIQITQPTAYFSGYTLYTIPYENKYYKLIFKDDALLPSDWDFYTVYSPLLDNTDIPYSVDWQHIQEIENPDNHEYWTIQLVRNDKQTASSDVSCAKAKLTLADLKKYKPEYIFRTESGSTVFGVFVTYEY